MVQGRASICKVLNTVFERKTGALRRIKTIDEKEADLLNALPMGSFANKMANIVVTTGALEGILSPATFGVRKGEVKGKGEMTGKGEINVARAGAMAEVGTGVGTGAGAKANLTINTTDTNTTSKNHSPFHRLAPPSEKTPLSNIPEVGHNHNNNNDNNNDHGNNNNDRSSQQESSSTEPLRSPQTSFVTSMLGTTIHPLNIPSYPSQC